MKKNQIFALWIFVFVVLASLAFWSCGGGGGGGEVPETNVALTAENSPKAAAGILKALDIANALQGISGIISPATSSEGASMTQSPIGSLLMMTTTALKKNEQGTTSYTSGSFPIGYSRTVECPDGGTMVLRNASWTSPDPLTEDNFEEAVNFKSDVTFNSCKKSTVTLNGSGNVAVTGVLSSPSAVTVSGSLTYSDSSTSTTLVLTNTKVTVSNIAPDYDMSNATIFIEYGTLQATIAGENSLLRFKNFTVGLASIPTGTMATLSGQIRSGCLETWLTVSTTSPVTILNGETCPTEGIVSASYNGNTIRAVIASAPPNITLYFNGTPLGTTYESCTDLKATCP